MDRVRTSPRSRDTDFLVPRESYSVVPKMDIRILTDIPGRPEGSNRPRPGTSCRFHLVIGRNGGLRAITFRWYDPRQTTIAIRSKGAT